MTPATREIVERLARDAASMAGEPNSEPTALMTHICERFWSIAMEHAAGIAQATVCDVHLPTGVKIYGARAAAAIREAGK